MIQDALGGTEIAHNPHKTHSHRPAIKEKLNLIAYYTSQLLIKLKRSIIRSPLNCSNSNELVTKPDLTAPSIWPLAPCFPHQEEGWDSSAPDRVCPNDGLW